MYIAIDYLMAMFVYSNSHTISSYFVFSIFLQFLPDEYYPSIRFFMTIDDFDTVDTFYTVDSIEIIDSIDYSNRHSQKENESMDMYVPDEVMCASSVFHSGSV